MQRRLLGKEHPDVAMTLNNLAFVVHDKGDLKTATRAVARVPRDLHAGARRRPSFRRARHEQSRDVDDGSQRLRCRGEVCCARRWRCASSASGRSTRMSAGTMTLLAGVLIETKRYDEALQAFGRRARPLPEVARPRALAHRQRGERRRRSARGTRSNSSRPSRCSWRAVAVLHGGTGALTYFLKSSDRWLGRLYQSTGRPEKAAKYLAQAVRSS